MGFPDIFLQLAGDVIQSYLDLAFVHVGIPSFKLTGGYRRSGRVSVIELSVIHYTVRHLECIQ